MITVKEIQLQFSDLNPSNSDHMAHLQPGQNYSSHCILPMLTANVTFPGYPVSNLPGSYIKHQGEIDGLLELPPPNCDMSFPIGNPIAKDSQGSLLLRLGVTANIIDSSCTQKKFLIFDRSGNDTRLYISTSFSHQHQNVASKSASCANDSCGRLVDELFSVNPDEEKWDENHLSDEEDEMLEDTEEINALLYSDSDGEYHDDAYDENDEVASTGHTPFLSEEACKKDKLFEEATAEKMSFDYSPKRQKLLDGGCKKSSLMIAERPTELCRLHSNEDDVESSAVGRNSSYDADSSMREKKVKIRETLKILESTIPGLKSKDPISVIDEAIVYLKYIKLEAESLGLTRPNGKLTSLP